MSVTDIALALGRFKRGTDFEPKSGGLMEIEKKYEATMRNATDRPGLDEPQAMARLVHPDCL
jgi:hypothetical protein